MIQSTNRTVLGLMEVDLSGAWKYPSRLSYRFLMTFVDLDAGCTKCRESFVKFGITHWKRISKTGDGDSPSNY